MNPSYRDRDGDLWHWHAEEEGYYTRDMWDSISLEELRDKYGPLSLRDDSGEWVQEPETQEQLFRRIVREELDRRFGRVHT